MQRISILLFLLVFCSATAVQAQAQAPKPSPEVNKLLPLVGHWAYEEEDKPGPLGPGGKSSGEYTAQMILGGFFMQGVEREKGPAGKMLALGIEAYDPASKNFTSNWYYSDGTVFSGTLTASGNTFTWAGKLVAGGKQYLMKEPCVISPDLMSGTITEEISVDGKTWVPAGVANMVKVKLAAKK
jgi:hypothetical protein